jgi:hypothetical protein
MARRISGDTPSSSNVFIKSLYIFIFRCKDNASREQNKINSFIFYAEAQLIFAFGAKIRVFWRLITNH